MEKQLSNNDLTRDEVSLAEGTKASPIDPVLERKLLNKVRPSARFAALADPSRQIDRWLLPIFGLLYLFVRPQCRSKAVPALTKSS